MQNLPIIKIRNHVKAELQNFKENEFIMYQHMCLYVKKPDYWWNSHWLILIMIKLPKLF